MHPNWKFNKIFGDTEEKIINEEKRLFYVALTRAINWLYIITTDDEETPFLNNLGVNSLSWETYPPIEVDNNLFVVKVGNQDGNGTTPTFQIREILKANSYFWESLGWECWEKTVPAKSFNISEIQKEIWAESAEGVEVRILDEKDSILAKYFVNKNDWKKEFDKIPLN